MPKTNSRAPYPKEIFTSFETDDKGYEQKIDFILHIEGRDCLLMFSDQKDNDSIDEGYPGENTCLVHVSPQKLRKIAKKMLKFADQAVRYVNKK